MKPGPVSNLLLLALMSAISLGAADLALFALAPRPPEPFMLRGMLQPDPELEHTLVPGFQKRFDDALARGEIRVNSHGQRDAEPTAAPPREGVEEWLVLGDSFAFGQRLDQSETIDAFVEKLAGGRVDAYNAGVPGYGPPNILGTLRRLDWFPAKRVFYLFFRNDLFASEQEVGGETVFDGWPVKARRPDGTPYTREELAAKVARAAASSSSTLAKLGAVLRLEHLRAALARALSRGGGAEASGDAPSDASVAAAARTTAAMRALAAARGASFSVVVIPSLEELSAGGYERHTRTYVEALRGEGIAIVEPLDALVPQDYLAGDGHLARSGAEKVARAMVDSTR